MTGARALAAVGAAVATLSGPVAAQTPVAELTRVLDELDIEMVRFESHVLANRTTRSGDAAPQHLDIWVYHIVNGRHQRLTNAGGYLSPLISPDGQSVWYVRGGMVWRRHVTSGNEVLVAEADSSARLLIQFTEPGHRSLFVVLGDRLDRLAELDLGSKALTTRTFTTVWIQKLIEISRQNSEGTLVLDDAFEGDWDLLIRREHAGFNEQVTNDAFLDRDPSWWGAGRILYVSNRP